MPTETLLARLARRAGVLITKASERILRVCYGIRRPAASIRLNDLIDDRDFVIGKLSDALDADKPKDIDFWIDELLRCETEIAHAELRVERRAPTMSSIRSSGRQTPHHHQE
ncbi:MAG: hypothetical protein ABTR92_19745 [Candidatus Accumulibacter phosphatis]